MVSNGIYWPSLPGGSPEEAWPAMSAVADSRCGSRRLSLKHLPRQHFWKGNLSSGLHGHHKGIRGSLWVQKCMSFFLLFSSILISMTLPAKQVIEYHKFVTEFVFIQYCSHFFFLCLVLFK